ADASVQRSAAVDLAVIDCLDAQLGALELYLTRTAKVDDVQTYHRLQTIPGVGKVLALVLLYEIHDIARFASEGQFLSYARLVRPRHESAGKVVGWGGQKIGNAHLRWAFAEAACLFLRSSERAKKWKQKQQKKRGEGRALAILAARLGRAVYHIWRKGEAFDEARFWQGQQGATKEGDATWKTLRVPLLCPCSGRSAMPLIDLRQARAEIHLACVLELLGWRARERCGEQVRGPRPVHRSRSPTSRSFSAHLGKGA